MGQNQCHSTGVKKSLIFVGGLSKNLVKPWAQQFVYRNKFLGITLFLMIYSAMFYKPYNLLSLSK